MERRDRVNAYIIKVEQVLHVNGRGKEGLYHLSKIYREIALDQSLNTEELESLRLRLDIIREGWLKPEEKKLKAGRDEEKIKVYVSMIEEAVIQDNFKHCFYEIYKKMAYDATLTIVDLKELRLRMKIMKEDYNTYLQRGKD